MEINQDARFQEEGDEEDEDVEKEQYEPKLSFVKRKGVENDGWDYEIVMTTLYALKFALQENMIKLCIATNLDGYGAFDDVIIRVEYKRPRRPELYLIQLKYKMMNKYNEVKEISTNEFYKNNGFWLKKYKDCYYKDIKKKFEDTDSLTEGIFEEDIVMCLLTNTGVKGACIFPLETHLICSKFSHNRPDDLINTKSDGSYKFEIHQSFPKRSKFLYELLQGNFWSSDISRLICKDHPSWAESADLKEIISYYQSELIKKFKEGDDAYENIVEQIRDKLSKNKVTIMTSEKYEKVKAVTIHFKKELKTAVFIFDTKPDNNMEYINFVSELFKSNKNLIEREIRSSDTDFFKNISVERFPKAVSEYLNKISNRKVRGNRESESERIFERIEKYLLYKYKLEKEAEYSAFYRRFLFYFGQVDVTEAKETIASLLEKSFGQDGSAITEQFLNYIKAHFKQRNYFALTKRDIKMKLLELLTGLTDAKELTERYKVFENISDMSNYSQRIDVLRRVKVSIQGRQAVNLAELGSKYFHEKISSAFLLKNLDQIIHVGLEENLKPDIYVKRNFFKILLRNDALRYTDNNVFIFGGEKSTNSTDLTESRKLSSYNHMKRNLLVNLEGRRISDIVNDIKQQVHRANCPMHLLKKRSGKYLEWQRSWNSINDLSDFLVERECVDEHEVLQYFGGGFNVVSAAPGMGKTTTLHVLANYCRPDVLVLKLNLNARYKDLRENDNLKSNPLSYLMNLMKSSSVEKEIDIFEDQLFLDCFEENRVIVFIDAFDEIISDSAVLETTFSIIERLRDRKITVWLFTRPLALSHIQNKYNTLAINMAGFTEDDLKIYLTKTLPAAEQAKVNKFLKGNSLTLYSVPHYLHMLVSICDQSTDMKNLKVTDLYDQFVQMIFDKYCEVRRIDLERNNIIMNLTYQEYFRIHKVAGLCVIYGRRYLIENQIFSEVKLNNILNQFSECENNFGMVVMVRDGNPIFSHRTYAEYWTAVWLFDSYSMCNNKVSCKCKHHGKHRKMYEYLFDSQFRYVRVMFDMFASQDRQIHSAVLEGDFDKVEKATKTFSKDTYIDKFGRTPLHLALSYISRGDNESIAVPNSIIKQLVVYAKANHCCLHQSDYLLGWNCYKYAKASGVKYLLHEISECSIPEILKLMVQPSKRCFLKCNRKVLPAFFNWDRRNLKALVDQTDLNMRTALHVASQFGNISCVEYLIKLGADVNSKTRTQSTPMHFAAKKGNVEVLKLLYTKGGNVSVIDENQYTPLHLASFYGHLNCVEYLVKIQSNKNSSDKSTVVTAIRIAAEEGHVNILKLLCTKTSNFRVDEDMHTLLHIATLAGHIECVRYLIQLRCNIYAKTITGDTSMHLAAYKGYNDILKLLHENGGKVNETNSLGTTSLHEATLKGHIYCVRYLIQVGADVNANEMVMGYSPVHFAAYQENMEFLKLLTENGGDVNSANYKGLTPLHIVAIEGFIKSLKYLIEFGANIDLRDNTGRTAMHLAALNNRVDSLRLLIESGGNVNLRDSRGHTVLHTAASSGLVTCVQYLIDENFNVNNRTTCEENATAVCLAAKGGHTGVLKVLTEAGGDFNLVDSYGRAALHLAIENGRTECARYLLDIGADADLDTESKQRFMRLAAREGHKFTHNLLIQSWRDSL